MIDLRSWVLPKWRLSRKEDNKLSWMGKEKDIVNNTLNQGSTKMAIVPEQG